MKISPLWEVGALVLLIGGCRLEEPQASVSYEARLRHAEGTLAQGKWGEGRRLVLEALKKKPGDLRAQKLMAQVIDREIQREKFLSEARPLEELAFPEKNLLVKTWLERSEGFLEIREYPEALRAAEEALRLDPENPEASRLIDRIKERARREGREEDLFLQGLYQAELRNRLGRYLRQAREGIQTGRLGVARFALEKALFLDPKNPEGERLLKRLEEAEKA